MLLNTYVFYTSFEWVQKGTPCYKGTQVRSSPQLSLVGILSLALAMTLTLTDLQN